MKFLFYSVAGEGAQLAKRIEMEGNTVGIYIKDKIYKTVYDGLLEKVENPDSYIDKDTIIIFDISGNGDVADKYKRKGHFVYGASSFADQLENDRSFGTECMLKAGIKTPEFNEFSDFQSACSFIEQAKTRLVFKPTGSMPCKLTYVSKNSEELVQYMKFVEKKFSKDIKSFILQEFIEGVVVSSEFFCDGTKFLRPGNHTVEDKKSMNDGLGASTGCSGNITWPCEDSKIMEQGVSKIEKLCIENQYVGQIDLNAVVNSSGVYGLEWTPRFGYDATPTLLALSEIEIGKLFSDIVHGQARNIDLMEEYAGSIRVSIPPYPAEPMKGKDPEKFSPSIGVPILDWAYIQEEIYFYEVMMEDNQLVHSGGTGVIACTLGISADPAESLEDAYTVADNLCIPDKQYRTDLTQVLSEMLEGVEEFI
jgi:phosphoribosylamine-glycine ligase